MPGSLRKRGNSWELRAYAGADPETGKRHWVSATVKASRRAAQQELAELVSRVDYPRRMTSQATVAKFLIDWFDAVSPNWSPTTASQTKSVIDHHLIPRLGYLPLQRLRTEYIDALYGELQRSGGPDGRPLTAAPCIAFTLCSTARSSKPSAGVALGQSRKPRLSPVVRTSAGAPTVTG